MGWEPLPWGQSPLGGVGALAIGWSSFYGVRALAVGWSSSYGVGALAVGLGPLVMGWEPLL